MKLNVLYNEKQTYHAHLDTKREKISLSQFFQVKVLISIDTHKENQDSGIYYSCCAVVFLSKHKSRK